MGKAALRGGEEEAGRVGGEKQGEPVIKDWGEEQGGLIMIDWGEEQGGLIMKD